MVANKTAVEELKQMKLQVLKSMSQKERKRVYNLIKTRANLLTAELLQMKEDGERPTVSYLQQEYNISGKAIHLKLIKIFGENYSNIDPTLKAQRNYSKKPKVELPTIKELKKKLKCSEEKIIELVIGVAEGKRKSKHVSKRAAVAFVKSSQK